MLWCGLCAVLILPLGCKTRDLDAVGEPDTPFVLMLSPAYEVDAAERERLDAALEEASGLTVEVRVARSEGAAVASAGAYHVDAWLLPVFDYLLCRREYDVEAGLQVVRAGDTHEYTGEILVRADSGIESLDQLSGKTMGYVSRYSTSGYLLAMDMVREAGVEVSPVFTGSHRASLEALREGTVDAIATYVGAEEEDPSLRAIATTESIPNEPVFFRSDLKAETRQRFSDGLVAMAGTPEGQALLGEMADITGFVPVSDEVYEPAFELIREAGENIEDLVPQGWWIVNENRRGASHLEP
jgi:phosphonate transport system substrate-binding protein